MLIGKLYKSKCYFWMLFPSLDVAKIGWSVQATYESYKTHARMESELWSKKLKANVSYIEPNTTFLLLEHDENPYLKRILAGDGSVGWIVLDEYLVKDNVKCFEELKAG